MKKNFTRRGFISSATAVVAGAGVSSGITSSGLISCTTAVHEVNEGKSKSPEAVREVMIAEQLRRMMQSDYAILEFEDLRLQFESEQDHQKTMTLLDQMKRIVYEEITRTELSLVAATRDSRLGFQFEQDYVYTPYSLKEKLGILKETLNVQLKMARKRKSM